jgi:hypothetical protein
MALLKERKQKGSMTFETKKLLLDKMKVCGSLEYAKGVLRNM